MSFELVFVLAILVVFVLGLLGMLGIVYRSDEVALKALDGIVKLGDRIVDLVKKLAEDEGK